MSSQFSYTDLYDCQRYQYEVPSCYTTVYLSDLKVSHKDPFDITFFAQYLSTKYGEQLSVKRGRVHEYIGMDLDYYTKGGVQIGMNKYLQKVEDKFPEHILGTAKSPAGEHLFQVHEDTEPQKQYLKETRASQFHRVVAQLLFLSSRARLDIQTTVSFLTSHVRKPVEDDWGKLVRCMTYLKGTKYMKLTLTVDTMSIIKWWVDASHNTHMD